MKETYYWRIHHDVIAEPTEDIWERKKYVREYKHKNPNNKNGE